jgi:2-amino-4-hydroxy-6-hydroxymethyldihydropteridine diphosphokinase
VELTLPHPEMQNRRFVLEPLGEIAADWVHPVLGLSVGEMLLRLGGEGR